MRKLSLLLGLCVVASTHSLFASPLSGTTVTGALYFAGDPVDNWFDPANGYGNTTSVVIGSANNTFVYDDGGYNTDTAEFTDLDVTDIVHDAGLFSGASAWSMVFTDPAFSGFSGFSEVSGDSLFTFVSSGDTIKINFAGTDTPGIYSADLVPTPEPSSQILILLGSGLVLLGFGFWHPCMPLNKHLPD